MNIIKNIILIPSKLIKILNYGAFGILVSVVLYDQISFPYKDIIVNISISAIVILLSISFLLIIVNIIRHLLSCLGGDLYGKACHYVWQFVGCDGTLETTVTYEIKNITLHPKRTILNDSEGFVTENLLLPNYKIIERETLPNTEIMPVIPANGVPFRKMVDYAGGTPIYQAEWAVAIEPPLMSFETIKFLRQSVNEKVEARAFTEQGSLFIFRCRMPYKYIETTTTAPPDYIFKNVKTLVDDESGKAVFLKPIDDDLRIIADKIIYWKIKYPGTTLRYKLSFNLELIKQDENK